MIWRGYEKPSLSFGLSVIHGGKMTAKNEILICYRDDKEQVLVHSNTDL